MNIVHMNRCLGIERNKEVYHAKAYQRNVEVVSGIDTYARHTYMRGIMDTLRCNEVPYAVVATEEWNTQTDLDCDSFYIRTPDIDLEDLNKIFARSNTHGIHVVFIEKLTKDMDIKATSEFFETIRNLMQKHCISRLIFGVHPRPQDFN